MSLENRHRVIQSLIARLQRKKPELRLDITLYACSGPGLDGARGFVKGFVRPGHESAPPALPTAPMGAAGGGLGGPPPTVAAPAAPGGGGGKPRPPLRPLSALKLGDYLHIAVVSPMPWYLHLFNLGTSGLVAKLFPDTPEEARIIQPDVTQFVTPMNGFSPFMGTAETFQENGPVNEYPEGFLAIVTRSREPLPVGDLCVEWAEPRPGPAHAAGNGWDNGNTSTDAERTFDGRLPLADWEWGCLSVPVES